MSGLKIRFRRCLVAVCALTLCCAVALGALSDPFTTITTDSVRMRRSPSGTATVLENLPQGATVEVIGESGRYFRVKYNGRTGYIQKDYLNTDSAAIVTPTPEVVETVDSYPYTTVTRDTVNLRAGRSVRSTLLRKIPEGAAVTVLSASGSWAGVTYGKYSGYVKSEFLVLKKVGKVKSTPTPTPVPTLSPEENAGSYQVLELGASGDDVKALQQALIELGYLTGTADGLFGAATQNAVIQLQLKNDYPTTDVVDANLQAFIYSGKPKNAKGVATKVNTLSPVSGASMKLGNTGDAVSTLQAQLKTLGYYTGEITGTYDAATQKAVKAFQKKNGLKTDGVAGSATQSLLSSGDALASGATATPAPTATATPAPTYTIPATTVKLNSQGTDASTVQSRLKELGYYKGKVDGKFGVLSVAALKKFQAANGLKDDGIAGSATLARLFSDTGALANGASATPAPEETAGAAAAADGTKTVTYITLRKGDGGDAVAVLQEALIALNYLTGTADGNYGEQTFQAVRAFQKANGLAVDGSAGPETLSLLYSGTAQAKATVTPKATAASGTAAAADAKTTPGPDDAAASSTLRKGDKGSAVKSLQQKLISLGYLGGKADGIYGTQTFNAVISFQRANKLKADGVAGEKTQSKLDSSSAVSADGTTPAPATATPAPTASPYVKPSAAKVIYANWYTTVKSVARRYPYATIYDYQTGISWQIHIFSVGAHADYEPLTANDTSKMVKVFGGNTWNPRAVWVVFGDGSVYMASTHSKPHDVQHITDNNFAGHSCLHFPRTQEQVSSIGQYATSHQTAIDAGWAVTQKMAQ